MLVDIRLIHVLAFTTEENEEFLNQVKKIFYCLQQKYNCKNIYLSFCCIEEYYILYNIIHGVKKYFPYIFIDFYYINKNHIEKILLIFNNIIKYRLLRFNTKIYSEIYKNEYHIFTETREIMYKNTNKIIFENCGFNKLLYLFLLFLI